MKTFRPKQLKLNEKGLNKVLGELESEVMKTIWRMNVATVREVCDDLAKKKKKRLSFNTVMTIMNRLLKKEILTRKMEGGSYRYSAQQTKETFLASVSSEVMESLIRDPKFFSAAAFFDLIEEIDPEALEELKNLVKKKKV